MRENFAPATSQVNTAMRWRLIPGQRASSEREARQLFFSMVIFVGLNSVFLIGITYFLRESLSALIIRSPEFGNILLVASCAECVIVLRQYYLFYFKNAEEAKTYTRYYIISSVLTFLFSLYFVAFAKVGVIGIVYGRLLANIINLILLNFP